MALGSLLVALATFAALPGPAFAVTTCNPGRSAYFYNPSEWAGVVKSLVSASPVYVRSTIIESDAYVVSGSSVSAWSMLNRGSSPYAQIGWWHVAGSARGTFIQYINNSFQGRTSTPTSYTLGSYTKYEVRAVVGGFTFLSNGYQWLYATDATWVPSETEFLGEVHNHNDQMPGSAHDREEFSNVQYSYDLRTWTDVGAGVFISDSNIYGSQRVVNGLYRIWDKACL